MPALYYFIHFRASPRKDNLLAGQRLALDVPGITVWLDGEGLVITGAKDPERIIVRTPSSRRTPLSLNERE